MNFSLWVDADSCPVQVRTIIIKFSLRLKIKSFFVANRKIPLSNHSKNSKELIKMIRTETFKDAADDYIVEHAEGNDLVITRDIPLASRLIEKEITVINDRGKTFTKENIKEELSIRNFNFELALCGIQSDRIHTYNQKDLNNFSNCLDREIQKKIRKQNSLTNQEKDSE